MTKVLNTSFHASLQNLCSQLHRVCPGHAPSFFKGLLLQLQTVSRARHSFLVSRPSTQRPFQSFYVLGFKFKDRIHSTHKPISTAAKGFIIPCPIVAHLAAASTTSEAQHTESCPAAAICEGLWELVEQNLKQKPQPQTQVVPAWRRFATF